MKRAMALLLLWACADPVPSVTVMPSTAVDVTTETSDGRELKRMDIDQLDASIALVTGVRWSEVVSGDTVQLFETLSGSLGKPDYQASTDEDLDATLLFQKFLDDAARMTCAEGIRRETTGGIEDKRLLVRAQIIDRPPVSDDAINANLEEMLLRIHGKRATVDTITPWRGLFDAVYDATQDPAECWRAVCVAMVTHPDFYAY